MGIFQKGYMQQLEGFVVKGNENMVHVSFKIPCMVWSNFLVNGTIRIMHVFNLKSLKRIMVTILIITLYVDDLNLAFNDLTLLKETKDNLSKKIEMVDLSEIQYYSRI